MFVSLFSQHLQLDSLSQEFNEGLETGLKASILSIVRNQAVGDDNDFFEARKELQNKFNFYYGEMMWGLNYMDSLDQYNPLEFEFQNGKKIYTGRSTRWKYYLEKSGSTQSGRTSWEQIAGCADSGNEYPRPNIFYSANSPSCFDRHATQDVRLAIEEAGDYHAYQIYEVLRYDPEVRQIIPVNCY